MSVDPKFLGDYALAMHLIGVHCNSAAISNPPAVNQDLHNREHFGPGGLCNHPWLSLDFDDAKVEQVMEEAEE